MTVRRRVAIVAALLWAAAALAPAALAQAPVPKPGAAATPKPAAAAAAPAQPAPEAPAPPPSIPVPEISQRAEVTAANLRSIEEGLEPPAALSAIEEKLPDRAKRIESRVGEATRMLEVGEHSRALGYLAGSITTVRDELDGWGRLLTERATALESQLDLLASDRALWLQTRDAAKASGAPPELLSRVQDTLAAIAQTRDKVDKHRAQILVLQDKVTRTIALADSTTARIAQQEKEERHSFLNRDATPIWRNDFGPEARQEMRARIGDSVKLEFARMVEYIETNPPRVVLRLLVFAVFALLFRGARTRMKVLAETEPQLAESSQVFSHWVESALVLTWLSTGWMDRSHQPPLVDLAYGLLFLVPGLRLLAALVGPELRGAPWIIAALVGIDSIREFLSLVPDLEQTIVVVEIGIVVASLAVLLRTGRLAGVELTPAEAKAIRPLGYGARIAIVVSLIALVAVAFGYLQIGRLLGRGVFTLLVAMMILYAALRAIDGLVAFALRTRPLSNLHMVERYRGLIEARVAGFFNRFATFLVGVLLIVTFQLWDPTVELVKGVADIGLTPGEAQVTVGHVVLFVATCFGAAQLSRFLRFVLEEDVYPRLNVARGVDYSISSLLHYVVLGLGILLAVSWVGFDMNRITVLGGAFAVGIGFGLQNIVNNFVSGIILLFERPIQIGDAVQIADVVGEVRRIGIRSSTLRTLEGAEVIVPNATLISDRVTNWTLSDRTRRVTIDVGVPYDNDPERILAILLEVAKTHPRVLVQPEPQAFFAGFGENVMNFRLQAWSSQDEFVRLRSELHVNVYRALVEAGVPGPYAVKVLPSPPRTAAPKR